MVAGTASPASKRRHRLMRLALALTSTALALVIFEVGYRVALWHSLEKEAGDRPLHVVSDSIYSFDRELGYSYVPGGKAVSIRVHGDRVADVWDCVVGRDGNIGDPSIADGWSNSRNRILVVGDSFTANPNYGGVAWPDDLHAALAERSVPSAVRNYARDGFGILQMITMAVAQAKRHDPSVIVIAFIIDDLTRQRFWRVNSHGRYPRLFVTTEPTENPDIAVRAELALVNKSVTSLRAGDKASFVREQYSELSSPVNELHRSALMSPDHIVLFNRLFHGNALADVVPAAVNPRHKMTSCAADERFVTEIASLRAREASLVLVQIPTCEEIEAGEYSIDTRSVALLASLRALLPQASYVDLIQHIEVPVEGARSAFLYPRNGHPSKKGARMYGAALARVLVELGLARAQ